MAPIIVINATTKDGKQVKGFKATVEYTEPGPNSDKKVHVVGGGRNEAIQDEQYDGRYRTSQLLPDREVNVTVSADGFATASRKLSAPRGEDRRGDLRAGAEVTPGSRPMRVVVAAAVGLLALLGARPSWAIEVEPVRLPDGSALPAVEFDRHVASLFGRLGCNAGSCHGSFQGRGGLNLSLFGHDPARDFEALTRGPRAAASTCSNPTAAWSC